MHGAAYKHLPKVVAFLARAGADTEVWNQPNAKGWTPLDIVEGVGVGINMQTNPPTAAAVRAAMEAAGVVPPPVDQ